MLELIVEGIRYSRLFSFGDHENESIGFTVIPEKGETEQDVFIKVTKMIVTGHNNHMVLIYAKKQLKMTEYHLRNLSESIRRHEEELDEARGYIERVRKNPEEASGKCYDLKAMQTQLAEMHADQTRSELDLRELQVAESKLRGLISTGKWFQVDAAESLEIPEELLQGHIKSYQEYYMFEKRR